MAQVWRHDPDFQVGCRHRGHDCSWSASGITGKWPPRGWWMKSCLGCVRAPEELTRFRGMWMSAPGWAAWPKVRPPVPSFFCTSMPGQGASAFFRSRAVGILRPDNGLPKPRFRLGDSWAFIGSSQWHVRRAQIVTAQHPAQFPGRIKSALPEEQVIAMGGRPLGRLPGLVGLRPLIRTAAALIAEGRSRTPRFLNPSAWAWGFFLKRMASPGRIPHWNGSPSPPTNLSG